MTVVLLLIVAPGRASTLTEDELTEELAVFGPGFLVTRIDAPVIENPYDWINRRAGDYTYRFVEGSDDGATRRTERHVPDTASPGTDREMEALRASALPVIRTREHNAKVLEAYPSAGH